MGALHPHQHECPTCPGRKRYACDSKKCRAWIIVQCPACRAPKPSKS